MRYILAAIVTLALMSLAAVPDTHMPFIVAPVAEPTEVPTAEPTPTDPPRTFTLEDGDYRTDISAWGDGWIDFTVTDNGGKASEAELLISRNLDGCFPVAYAFPGAKAIEDGKFYFFAVESNAIVAEINCTATSSTAANCTARRNLYANLGYCTRASGTATLKD